MNSFFEQLAQQDGESERMLVLYRRLEESDNDLVSLLDGMSEAQVRLLYAAVSASTFLAEELIQHPEWLKENFFDPEDLREPITLTRLRHDLSEKIIEEVASRNFDAAHHILLEFKTKHIFRIAIRDLCKLGDTETIIHELSLVADTCLQTVFRLQWLQLTERVGFPYHADANGKWHNTPFSVIGLGKLGGQELNYSSDVDVIFVYAEEGFVFNEQPEDASEPQFNAMSNHQFFTMLAEQITEEVSRSTRDGWLYRIDLRLRPEGNGGPLVRSLQSYENYYAHWGRTWERMMLIKMRHVAGSISLSSDFAEMIQSFRYPRSVNEQVPEEVAQVKGRIEKEVIRSGELQRNVKLGWGGIREIEFIVQTIQVIDAGKMPYLQGGQTLPMLEKLAVYDRLNKADSVLLSEAYKFYRDVEHRLQVEENRQTHTIPSSMRGKERLAKLMGCKTVEEFEERFQNYQQEVRRVFEGIVRSKVGNEDTSSVENLPADFEEGKQRWLEILSYCGFREPETAFKLVKTFVNGPGYVHVSKRTVELGGKLLPRFLRLCPSHARLMPIGEQSCFRSNLRTLSDPDRVLARLDSFIQNYGGRQGLFERWYSTPIMFDLFLLLFDRSEYLAEVAIKTPELIEEILEREQLRRLKSAREMLRDLEYGFADEDQYAWIRRYHRAELMRIVLRDLLGLSDFAQNQDEINALGEACVQYAMKVVMKKFRLKRPPFAIIGLGKFGGCELTYGSDLDIVFVCTPRWKGENKVQKMGFMLKDLLSKKTALGNAYKTDSRLRPDGEKGMLVSPPLRYERYYRSHAQLWEIQSLTRARVICGDVEVGFQFMDMARSMTNFSIPRKHVQAYRQDWKGEIIRMRQRVEKERTPYGKSHLAFKTGAGGLMDVEFLAQMLNMEFGWFQPNTRKALRLAASQDLLSEEDAEILIENFDKLMLLEKVLRRWSYDGESILPDTSAPLLRVAIRCGFDGIESFLEALGRWRGAIREVCRRVLGIEDKA